MRGCCDWCVANELTWNSGHYDPLSLSRQLPGLSKSLDFLPTWDMPIQALCPIFSTNLSIFTFGKLQYMK